MSNDNTDDELRAKLRAAVAMLMLAIERAQRDHPNTTIKLMLAAESPDGSGHIAARLDNAEFISDVAALVGYDKPTLKELAQFFLGSHGLTVERGA
jgi:hypothetical protein